MADRINWAPRSCCAPRRTRAVVVAGRTGRRTLRAGPRASDEEDDGAKHQCGARADKGRTAACGSDNRLRTMLRRADACGAKRVLNAALEHLGRMGCFRQHACMRAARDGGERGGRAGGRRAGGRAFIVAAPGELRKCEHRTAVRFLAEHDLPRGMRHHRRAPQAQHQHTAE